MKKNFPILLTVALAASCRALAVDVSKTAELEPGAHWSAKPGIPANPAIAPEFWATNKFHDFYTTQINWDELGVMGFVEYNPKLPRVLLIGDSISMGYTLDVRQMLKGKANVYRISGNGGDTMRFLANYPKYLGAGTNWDLIHFNWGLHDLVRQDPAKKYDSAYPPRYTVTEYSNQLEQCVAILKSTGAHLVWATTTPIPPNAAGRVTGDEVARNSAAAAIMQKQDIETDDLYALMKNREGDHAGPGNVHYTGLGYFAIAKQVTQVIAHKLGISVSIPINAVPTADGDTNHRDRGNVLPYNQRGEIAEASGPVCIVGRGLYRTPSQAFANAKDGDRIEIQAGIYHDVAVLKANNVTLVGVNGQPQIDGQSKIADGRGIWVIYGNNTTLDNFEMLHEDNGKRGEAAWDQAAIYLVGNNLTLRHMYIHDNMQGFFNATRAGSQCNLTIENSIFAHNGDGGGHSHNIYANHNITKLTMRGVWSRDCRGGHILKVRAFESDIQGCMFTDPNGISLNWFLDFPDGGKHKFAGNIVEHDNQNPGSVLIAYGEEGLLNPAPHEMLIAQNTFINDGEGTFFKIQHIAASLCQNIFAGKNTPIDAGNQTVNKAALENPAELNYRVAKPDQGATNYAAFMYKQHAKSIRRNDASFGAYAPDFRPGEN